MGKEKLNMSLDNYIEILNRIAKPVKNTKSEKLYYFSNSLTYFYVKVNKNYAEEVIIMDKDKLEESTANITIQLFNKLTFYEYQTKEMDLELTLNRIDPNLNVNNFENTIKRILHLPSYVKYKIKTLI
jgi:hypothetical protein